MRHSRSRWNSFGESFRVGSTIRDQPTIGPVHAGIGSTSNLLVALHQPLLATVRSGKPQRSRILEPRSLPTTSWARGARAPARCDERAQQRQLPPRAFTPRAGLTLRSESAWPREPRSMMPRQSLSGSVPGVLALHGRYRWLFKSRRVIPGTIALHEVAGDAKGTPWKGSPRAACQPGQVPAERRNTTARASAVRRAEAEPTPPRAAQILRCSPPFPPTSERESSLGRDPFCRKLPDDRCVLARQAAVLGVAEARVPSRMDKSHG